MSSRVVGRYVVHDEIASGGAARVHVGRLYGSVGFARTVAIKALHPHLSKDPELRTMLIDEARVATRVRHPNVVPTLDVLSDGPDLLLVMEYVEGESVARLMSRLRAQGRSVPPRIAVAIASDVLLGLAAAHAATDDHGAPLHLVHRDVSPQNVLVGTDGSARLIDFGVAKAVGRLQTTREGQIKGKLPYMAPEQVRGAPLDARCNLYAASVVLWEMLTGRRLFAGESAPAVMTEILEKRVEVPSAHAEGITPELDALVLRGLSRDPAARLSTAAAMVEQLARVAPRETSTRIASWLEELAGPELARRAAIVASVERAAMHEEVARALDAPAAPPPPSPVPPSPSPVAPPSSDPRRARGNAIAAAAALVFLGGAGVAAYRFGGAPGASPTPLEAAASAPASAGGAAERERPRLAATVPGPNDEPAEADTSLAITKASANAVAPPALHGARGDARPSGAPRKPRPSCSPPYTVDPTGIHIPKPECF